MAEPDSVLRETRWASAISKEFISTKRQNSEGHMANTNNERRDKSHTGISMAHSHRPGERISFGGNK